MTHSSRARNVDQKPACILVSGQIRSLSLLRKTRIHKNRNQLIVFINAAAKELIRCQDGNRFRREIKQTLDINCRHLVLISKAQRYGCSIKEKFDQ